MNRNKTRATTIALVAICMALAGCGSRLTDAELKAGAFGVVVTDANGNPVATTGDDALPITEDGQVLPPVADAGVGTDPGTTAGTGTAVAAPDGGTGTGGSPTGGSGGGGAVANKEPITIGQIGEFSGIAGAAQGPAQTALQAWVKYVNARGGVSGHQVRLVSLDSGGDAAKTKSMAQRLVEQDRVVAIVGAFVALSFPGLAAYTQPNQFPVIGGDLSDAGWHTNSYFFPQGTTQSKLNLGFAKTAAQAGKKKLAFFYCVELPACSSSYNALKNGGAKSQGVDLVYGAQVSVGTLNFQPQCTNAKNAGANAVYIIGDAGMTSRMLRDCRQIGLDALYLAPGIGTADSMKSDPNAQGLVGMSYAFPYVDRSSRASQDFQKAMDTYARGANLNGAAAQAWVAAQLFAEAVAKIPVGEKVTPKSVVQGLYKVSGTTVGGLTSKLVFVPGKPAPAIPCYFSLRIAGGKWVSDGLRPQCV